MAQLFAQMTADDPPKNIVSGTPETFYKELVGTGKLNAGVWACTAGAWDVASWSVDEVFIVQEGVIRLTAADGTTHMLRAGDTFFIPKGWQGRWETVEDVKKFYVLIY